MNDLVKIENNEIVIASEVIEQFKEFKKIKEEMDLKEKEVKQQLMDAMEKVGVKSWAFNGIYAEIKHVDGKTTIDSKRLKEELPDVYQDYSKTTSVSSSVTISVLD